MFGILRKKAIVFLLSDFIDADYSEALKVVARKHDITGIRIFDPAE